MIRRTARINSRWMLLKVKDTYHRVCRTKDGQVYIDAFDRRGVMASDVNALAKRLTAELGCDVLVVDEKDITSPR